MYYIKVLYCTMLKTNVTNIDKVLNIIHKYMYTYTYKCIYINFLVYYVYITQYTLKGVYVFYKFYRVITSKNYTNTYTQYTISPCVVALLGEPPPSHLCICICICKCICICVHL